MILGHWPSTLDLLLVARVHKQLGQFDPGASNITAVLGLIIHLQRPVRLCRSGGYR